MNVKIELSVDEVNLILSALGKLPLEQSVNAFFKVKTQAEALIAEAEKPAQDKDPE